MTGTKARSWIPALAPVVVLGLMLAIWPSEELNRRSAFSASALSERLENVTVDWRFQARSPADPQADDRIFVVGIGEYSLEKLGRWPWPRSHHGQLLLALTQKPPRSIAFDILFSEPSSDAEQDIAFSDGLSLHPGAITGAAADDSVADLVRKANQTRRENGEEIVDPVFRSSAIGKTRPLVQVKGDASRVTGAVNGPRPVEMFTESGWTGFVNAPPSEIDSMRRRIPLVVRYGDHLYPSLVLQSLIQYEGVPVEAVEVDLGNAVILPRQEGEPRFIPIDSRGLFRINYRGQDSFEPREYVGLFTHLANFAESGTWPAPEDFPPVQDQILLVGQTAEGLTDFGPTPLKPLEPLVLVHANALNNILQEDYLTLAPRWPVLAGWLAISWACLLGLRKLPISIGVIVPLIILVAYVFLAFWIFRSRSFQLPLFLPVLGFIAVNGSALVDRVVVEIRHKGRIKAMFGTYVSPEVVDQMVDSGDDPKLGGEEAEITAFFSDIQSFSSFSEKLPPARLVDLMIEYLSEMSDILQHHGGTLDKYIGDAIVGMFGAPLPYDDHAYRACCASIEVQARQAELREKWRSEEGWPDLVHRMQTRIGLNSGQEVIGNIGSYRRFNYTMMGDNVNLAARCESGAKAYGVYNMVAEETRQQVSAISDRIAFRYLDKIVVKGRTQPVGMYEIVGFASDLDGETRNCLDQFEEAMALYLARDWDAALARFESAAALEPNRPERMPDATSTPSSVMMARCRAMAESPPPDDWDGVYVMTSK